MNFNSIWGPHFDTDLEIMLDLINQGIEVFSLSCGDCFNNFCMSNQNQDKKYCKRCYKTLQQGLDLIKLPKENRLAINKAYDAPNVNFADINELKNYTIDGANIGLGVASSLMMITRDYNFNPALYKEIISTYLCVAYTVYKSLDEYQKKYNFDGIYLFNGRFGEYYSTIEYCKQNNINYFLHERGADIYRYSLTENDLIHRFDRYKEEIEEVWNRGEEEELKNDISKKWFDNRRDGVEQNWPSFTESQTSSKLPEGFNSDITNIAIFNSSFDEYAVFDDWQNPIEKNENVLIKNIFEHYKNDESKHFYLRVHPNLKNTEASQMKEIRELDKIGYKNLTIIYPEETVDSYALMDASDKTIVTVSTVGIESTYWGNVSIVAGKSVYDSLGCVYKVTNYQELFNLIDDNDLKPLPQETTYKYAYWALKHGNLFKHFEPTGLFHGKFLGVDLRKKPIWVKIRLAVQKFFKK